MVKLLDCTLRDGCYYTNWDFGRDVLEAYLSAVARLPVDAVEIGYANPPAEGYFGRFYYLTRQDLEPVRDRLRAGQKLGVMLDAKNCRADSIAETVAGLASIVEFVRMAVAPTAIAHGLGLARELKRIGFEVGFNVMYLTNYADDLSPLVPLADEPGLVDSIALVQAAPVFSAFIVSGEERVLAIEGQGADQVFHGIGVDLDAASCRKRCKPCQ